VADLPDSKWGMLERPVLPTIRHVFRGPRGLCIQYVKVAEVILGKLRNSMALGSVELATRGVRLPDGTKIRVLRDQSSDILYIDTTETAYAPYKEFPYFDFSFIPKEHYMSPAGDDGMAYLLGDETLPLSDTNPNPKRPMGGYHYTGHPYWKGLPDKAETYPSNKAILWGNQFYFDAKGRNLVSWWHSPGGDLPIPIIRPGDYRATRGTDVFTLDVNGYLTAVDVQDGPPVYTPIHTTIRRQVLLPNGATAFTLPEFRFGHFTANYRFHILAPQLYRNNSKWDRYDGILTLLDDVAFIAGYTRCMVPLEEDENTYIHASDLLLFTVDVLKQEAAPVVYMANFAGIEEGYSSAIFDISPLIADALGIETALIDQEVTYPWRFNSTGTEAMWIVSVGDSLLRGNVNNIRLVWLVFSIDPVNATLAITDKKVLSYNIDVNSVSTNIATSVVPASGSDSFFNYSVDYVPGDCYYGDPHPLEDTEYWKLNTNIFSGTDRVTTDNRVTTDYSNDIPIAYSYSPEDERILLNLQETTESTEVINFSNKESYFGNYHKRTSPYGYWERWPHKDQYYETEIQLTLCGGGYSCVGIADKFTTFHQFLDVYTYYLDQYDGAASHSVLTTAVIATNNGLELDLIERTLNVQIESLTRAESRLTWKTRDQADASSYYSHYVVSYPGCGPVGEVGYTASTTDTDEVQKDSYISDNEKSEIISDEYTARLLTYSDLSRGVVEYKEFSMSYANTMDYINSVQENTSIINRNWYQYHTSLPSDTGLIITETSMPDTVEENKVIDGDVAYSLNIKSVVFDYINKEKKILYESTAYEGSASNMVIGSAFSQLVPGYYGTYSSTANRFFYINRLRQYLDRHSSFSGMVDISNSKSMRYMYSELHEKAYQMYLHDPIVLGAFFDAFDDQFVCESGIETNTPERDFLLENLPVTEEHRSLYPIALVRNRARVWGNPPTRIEKIKA